MSTKKSATQEQIDELVGAYRSARYREAVDHAILLLKTNPNEPSVMNVLGASMLALKALSPALEVFDLCLRLCPDFIEALSNKGNVLKEMGRLDEAIDCYRRAISLKPSFALGIYNLGNTYKEMGVDHDAMRYFERALWLEPDFASAGWNQALLLLRYGDYRQGWALYEHGWAAGQRGQQRHFEEPLWLGETALDGETLLIHWEQGYGDILQFCRYIPQLWEVGVQVVLWVPPALKQLMLSLRGTKAVVSDPSELPRFDRHCPLLSLPRAMMTELDSVPAEVPYLFAERLRVDRWREHLGERVRLRVGLVWSGGRLHPHDHLRSLPLLALKPLYELADVEFHSLQIDYRAEDLPVIAATGIHRHEQGLLDFADTAALISQLDLVISVDTSVAHLAGAIGKPVWILLHQPCDYRWMEHRMDTPWYPTARLFRQVVPGDWTHPVTAVTQAIEERAGPVG